jgi:hypothetical protein
VCVAVSPIVCISRNDDYSSNFAQSKPSSFCRLKVAALDSESRLYVFETDCENSTNQNKELQTLPTLFGTSVQGRFFFFFFFDNFIVFVFCRLGNLSSQRKEERLFKGVFFSSSLLAGSDIPPVSLASPLSYCLVHQNCNDSTISPPKPLQLNILCSESEEIQKKSNARFYIVVRDSLNQIRVYCVGKKNKSWLSNALEGINSDKKFENSLTISLVNLIEDKGFNWKLFYLFIIVGLPFFVESNGKNIFSFIFFIYFIDFEKNL